MPKQGEEYFKHIRTFIELFFDGVPKMASQRKSLLGYYLVSEGGIASYLELMLFPNSNANTLHPQSDELIKLPNDMSDNRPKRSLNLTIQMSYLRTNTDLEILTEIDDGHTFRSILPGLHSLANDQGLFLILFTQCLTTI